MLLESTKNNPRRQAILEELDVQEALGIVNGWLSAKTFIDERAGQDRKWGGDSKWPEIFKYIDTKYPYHRRTTSTGPH